MSIESSNLVKSACEQAVPERSEVRAYSISTACEKLGGISRSNIYRKIEAGQISARKLGSRTVIMAEEVDRYLNSLPSLITR